MCKVQSGIDDDNYDDGSDYDRDGDYITHVFNRQL